MNEKPENEGEWFDEMLPKEYKGKRISIVGTGEKKGFGKEKKVGEESQKMEDKSNEDKEER